MRPDGVPEVSILLPTYRATQYITAALDSVFAQSFQNFEVIVINDGCPDTVALEGVLQPYQSRIRYIKQANRGVSAACNTGIRAAHAPLIMRLDPDDVLEPTCVAGQIGLIREHPEYDAVYCNPVFFGDGDSAGLHWMDVNPSDGPVSFLSVVSGLTCPANPGSVIRREIMERIGYYDESLSSWEDWDVWMRILKADPPGRIGYQASSLVRYRLRAGSLTKQEKYMENAHSVLEKALRNFYLSQEETEAIRGRLALVRNAVEKVRGKRAIRDQRWRDAIQSFEYCQGYRPEPKTRAVLFLLRTIPWALPAGFRAWEYLLQKRAARTS